jgi:hypothetical protein
MECPLMQCCVALPVKLFSVGFRCREVGLDFAFASKGHSFDSSAVFLSDFLLSTANNGDTNRPIRSVNLPSAVLLTSRQWMLEITVRPARRYRDSRVRPRLNSIAICKIGRSTLSFRRRRETISLKPFDLLAVRNADFPSGLCIRVRCNSTVFKHLKEHSHHHQNGRRK